MEFPQKSSKGTLSRPSRRPGLSGRASQQNPFGAGGVSGEQKESKRSSVVQPLIGSAQKPESLVAKLGRHLTDGPDTNSYLFEEKTSNSDVKMCSSIDLERQLMAQEDQFRLSQLLDSERAPEYSLANPGEKRPFYDFANDINEENLSSLCVKETNIERQVVGTPVKKKSFKDLKLGLSIQVKPPTPGTAVNAKKSGDIFFVDGLNEHGDIFSRYEVVVKFDNLLGEGAKKQVFEAEVFDTLTRERILAAAYSTHHPEGSRLPERLRPIAGILHVIRTEEVKEGRLVVAKRLVPFDSDALKEKISALPFSRQIELIQVLMQKAHAALMALHQNGYYHLDIKPDNIAVNLIDIDLSNPYLNFSDLDVHLLDCDGLQSCDEKLGNMHFTYKYSSPSVLSRGPSTKSDVYSLGCSFKSLVEAIFSETPPTDSKEDLDQLRSQPRQLDDSLPDVIKDVFNPIIGQWTNPDRETRDISSFDIIQIGEVDGVYEPDEQSETLDGISSSVITPDQPEDRLDLSLKRMEIVSDPDISFDDGNDDDLHEAMGGDYTSAQESLKDLRSLWNLSEFDPDDQN